MGGVRFDDLRRFYAALSVLEQKLGGARTLASCSGRMSWPRRGIYFFREMGEERTDSGRGPRVVRVGTHALKENASTVLWTRLSQHRGRAGSGSGNHRGSIFRLIVGKSLIVQRGYEFPTWGNGNSAPKDIRAGEVALECEVSGVIGAMPFLWLGIDDEAGPASLRGYVERNAIALLSNYRKEPLDEPSSGWLGHHRDRERVRSSGLWNSNHVDESCDPAFLETLERLIDETETAP
jgi:hypothetical protein